MTLQELLREVNLLREGLKLPPVSAERFVEDITVMQVLGKVRIENGMVTNARL